MTFREYLDDNGESHRDFADRANKLKLSAPKVTYGFIHRLYAQNTSSVQIGMLYRAMRASGGKFALKDEVSARW